MASHLFETSFVNLFQQKIYLLPWLVWKPSFGNLLCLSVCLSHILFSSYTTAHSLSLSYYIQPILGKATMSCATCGLLEWWYIRCCVAFSPLICGLGLLLCSTKSPMLWGMTSSSITHSQSAAKHMTYFPIYCKFYSIVRIHDQCMLGLKLISTISYFKTNCIYFLLCSKTIHEWMPAKLWNVPRLINRWRLPSVRPGKTCLLLLRICIQ